MLLGMTGPKPKLLGMTKTGLTVPDGDTYSGG
jgi:hypothetical protein